MVFLLVLGIFVGLYGHILYRQWREDVFRNSIRRRVIK